MNIFLTEGGREWGREEEGKEKKEQGRKDRKQKGGKEERKDLNCKR